MNSTPPTYSPAAVALLDYMIFVVTLQEVAEVYERQLTKEAARGPERE